MTSYLINSSSPSSQSANNVKETMMFLLSIFKKQLAVISTTVLEYIPHATISAEYRDDAILLGFEIDYEIHDNKECSGKNMTMKGTLISRVADMYFVQRCHNGDIIMLCAEWDHVSMKIDSLNDKILVLCNYYLGLGLSTKLHLCIESPLDDKEYNNKWKCYNLLQIFMSIYGTIPCINYRFYSLSSLSKFENRFIITLRKKSLDKYCKIVDSHLTVGFINDTTIIIKANITVICQVNSITSEIVAKLQKIFDYNCPENGWLNSLVLD